MKHCGGEVEGMSEPNEFFSWLGTLEAHRWKEDMVVTNPFQERVWLKALFEDSRRIGVTDCCPESDPCDWHGTLSVSRQRNSGPQ